jgi:exosortase E/protease (VPEID-CTERM system)
MLHDRTHGPPSVLASKDPLPAVRFPLWNLLYRCTFLAVLFALELISISAWLDTDALDGKGGLIGAVGDFGPYILQAIVLFATVLLALGYAGAKNAFLVISDQLLGVPPAWHFLIAHFATMSAFAFLSFLLFGGTPLAGTLLVLAWLAAGICGIATGVFFCIPAKILRKLIVSSGNAWLYATAAAVITPLIGIASHRLWKPATALTFEMVRGLVGLFSSSVIADPINKTIGTQKFVVKIAPSCSGLEGVGLMLVFSVIWLWFFRSDYKFPPALLIIPVGISLIFLLNAVRIAILILIGDAGARSVAVGGFHSQAGWIVFNGVALSLVCVANRVPWLSSRRTSVANEEAANDPSAYIVPFLAILAAAMISRAASGGLEWLYPLRFIAAVGALWLYRRQYATMNWSFGWIAPVVGALVFLLWIGLDRIVGTHLESGMSSGLVALPTAARMTWLVFRVMAAVITVPIAEELAFRGFLLRRLISIDFESISLQRWSFFAVALSSLAFGILHGDRWIAGTVAGILYATAQKWNGRIGDAVVAHGVTNALISVWVLHGGHWSLW